MEAKSLQGGPGLGLMPSGIDYVPVMTEVPRRTSTPSPSSIFAEWTEEQAVLTSSQLGQAPPQPVAASALRSKETTGGNNAYFVNPPSSLFSRRQMYNEGKRSQSHSATSAFTSSPPSSRTLQIDTSPVLASRPAFHRRKSSLSSVHTDISPANASKEPSPAAGADSSPDASEIATPTVSPFSSYTYTSGSATTSQTSIPGSGCSTGPLRSAFARDHLVSARPPLLRSISEDMAQVSRRRSVAFRLPGDHQQQAHAGQGGEMEALQMQARALTYGAAAAYAQPIRRQPFQTAARQAPETVDSRPRSRTQSAQAQIQNQSHDERVAAPSLVQGEQGDLQASSSSIPAAPSSDTTPSIRWPSARRVNAFAVRPSPYSSDLRPDLDSPSRALLAGLDAATTEAIRRAAATVRSQIPLTAAVAAADGPGQGEPMTGVGEDAAVGRDAQTGSLGANSGIMGNCGSGFFGDAIREKVMEMMTSLLPACSAIAADSEIKIVEYGSLKSTSACLIKPIMGQCSSIRSPSPASPSLRKPSFTVVHSDSPGSDFRPLMRQMDNAASDSCYVSSSALCADVYPSFVARPFGAQICPSASVDVGFSLMDLHTRRAEAATIGSSTSPASLAAAATAAHMDLQAFLRARAAEFKTDGLLVLAYIQRAEDPDVPLTTAPANGAQGHLGRAASLHEARHRSDRQASISQSAGAILSKSIGASVGSAATASTYPSEGRTSSPASTSATSLLSSPETSLSPASSAHIALPLSRCRSGSSPCSTTFSTEPKHRDIWSAIPALLASCIQRLVSTGLIKSDTAHKLLAPPLHPRTPAQTIQSLQAAKGQWRLEWACGLPEFPITPPSSTRASFDAHSQTQRSPSTPTPASSASASSEEERFRRFSLKESLALPSCSAPMHEPILEDALHLAHPAYTAYQAEALSRIQFAEHALQFIRVLYEAHFRSILRDHAKLSRSRLEEVLDALNEVLREKIEEPGRAALPLELECCVLALRRL